MGNVGRPVSNNPRIKHVDIRLTLEESEMLDTLCDRTGMCKSDVIREVIKKSIEEYKKGE